MDESQAKGMPSDKAAGLILKGIRKDKYEIFFGGKQVLAVYIKRFLPDFFVNFIRKQKVE